MVTRATTHADDTRILTNHALVGHHAQMLLKIERLGEFLKAISEPLFYKPDQTLRLCCPR